jgi:hypothetical protein
MGKKLFTGTVFLICLFSGSLAQSFSLKSFDSDRQQVKKGLTLTGNKGVKFDKIYSDFNKELLKMNDEIIEKNSDQIKSLISKKFKMANDRFRKILSPDEMVAVQNLNNSQMNKLTNGLVGKNGLMETYGLIDKNGRAKVPARIRVSVVVE